MEFKSKAQICTSREQSERLVALGLKKETADMVWHHSSSRSKFFEWELNPHPPVLKSTTHMNIDKLNVFEQKNAEGRVMTGEEYFDMLWGKDIPAWSLQRLIEIYAERYISCCVNLKDLTYDWIIDEIEVHIKEGDFNKEYLENR